MEQSEGVSKKAPQSEPSSKRQLDFGGVSMSSGSSGVLAGSQLRPVVQQLPMKPVVVQTPPITQSLLMQMQAQAQVSHRPAKPESPKARPRQNPEVKDGTPKKQKQCNCKHSRCLKLYCECFASGIYCDGCNCVHCHNNVENEPARREAVESTLERNPNAFRPKIASSPHGTRDNREEAGEVVILAKHNKGCHCKKSGCLKKYCECFQANILCSENCRCMDCKNYEGSEERQALFHGDHANNIAFMHQAANAAITGAIGSSGYGPPVFKKRKGQELFFGSTAKDSSIQRHPQFQQTNFAGGAAPSSLPSNPDSGVSNCAPVGPSKSYRSLLEGLVQPADLKELCSVLVVYTGETGKIIEDRNAMEKEAEDHKENSLTSSNQERCRSQREFDAERSVIVDRSSASQTEKVIPAESSSDGADVSNGRPMSPGTLALMCDEQDTVFAASQSGVIGHGDNTSSQLPQGEGLTETYVEQERIILTKFRDCLNKLITLGQIKERKCSTMAQTESEDQIDGPSNTTANGSTGTTNHQGLFNNGVAAHSTLPPVSMVPRTINLASVSAASNNNNLQSSIPYTAENGTSKQ
ncbi:CRC domain-containing protein [Heracleum sosnowskyi]|uniref:CRC domain-containing protein n=1 Tax=Heracleum sosnowskyi TaxID=360622 RepID=A0AAD8I345_9APIA|nr:CRC domain-containing protein [Heracleum sosnowskyi]